MGSNSITLLVHYFEQMGTCVFYLFGQQLRTLRTMLSDTRSFECRMTLSMSLKSILGLFLPNYFSQLGFYSRRGRKIASNVYNGNEAKLKHCLDFWTPTELSWRILSCAGCMKRWTDRISGVGRWGNTRSPLSLSGWQGDRDQYVSSRCWVCWSQLIKIGRSVGVGAPKTAIW